MITTMTPPYMEATREQRDAAEAWLRLHNINPGRTPIEAWFELDQQANEWRFEQHAVRNNGSKYVDHNGEIACKVLRRAFKADPPWLATDA